MPLKAMLMTPLDPTTSSRTAGSNVTKLKVAPRRRDHIKGGVGAGIDGVRRPVVGPGVEVATRTGHLAIAPRLHVPEERLSEADGRSLVDDGSPLSPGGREPRAPPGAAGAVIPGLKTTLKPVESPVNAGSPVGAVGIAVPTAPGFGFVVGVVVGVVIGVMVELGSLDESVSDPLDPHPVIATISTSGRMSMNRAFSVLWQYRIPFLWVIVRSFDFKLIEERSSFCVK